MTMEFSDRWSRATKTYDAVLLGCDALALAMMLTKVAGIVIVVLLKNLSI